VLWGDRESSGGGGGGGGGGGDPFGDLRGGGGGGEEEGDLREGGGGVPTSFPLFKVADITMDEDDAEAAGVVEEVDCWFVFLLNFGEVGKKGT
jgi:hypothetical protein